MKLTISLLSSGRDTVERCLQSLKPIQEALDAEIIVVDTAQDKETRKTLDKYADKVIDFKWIDDFSAARNAGLKQAKGEWFLYVDDDEWFLDAQPIIDFLKSDDKTYHWCDFRVFNFENYELTQYGEAWVTRMIRLNDDVEFIGAIHERFNPVIGDAKTLDAVIGHTGYIYKSQEEVEAHAKRNISLVEKMIFKEPNNPRWWVQMVQEYGALGDYDTLRDISEEYLALTKRIKTTDATRHYVKNAQGLFIACCILADLKQEKWKDAMKTYNRLVHGDYGAVATAQLDMMAATIFLHFNKISKAKQRCVSYMKNFEKYRADEEVYTGDKLYFLAETFAPKNMSIMQAVINRVIEIES